MTTLDDAINSASVTYSAPTVTALWTELLPGYAALANPLDAITDLTPQIGPGGVQVAHSLDDGLPDPVTMTTSNDAAGALTADLVGRAENRADIFSNTNPSSGVGSGTSISTTFPAGIAFGDYIVTAVSVNSTAVITPPDEGSLSWDLLASVSDATVVTHLFGRQHYLGATAFSATLGSSSAYTWAAVSFYASSAAGTLVDVRPGTPVTLAEAGTVTAHTIPGVVLDRRGWILSAWGRLSATATLSPTGSDVELIEQSGATVDLALVLSPFSSSALTRDVTVNTTATTNVLAAIAIPLRVMDRPKMDAKQYFSPFKADSPILGFNRDTAPVSADINIHTADGVTPTRIFTGQMQDVPVTGRSADLEAVSKTRILLNRSLVPPTVSGHREGVTVDWFMTWLAARGGQFAGPAPNRYTRYWNPLYGSMHAHYDSDYPYNVAFNYRASAPMLLFGITTPDYITGPFHTAMWAQQLADETKECYLNPDTFLDQVPTDAFPHITAQGGPFLYDFMSQANSKGRLSFWIRCDPAVSAPSYMSAANDYLMTGNIRVIDRTGVYLGYVEWRISSATRIAQIRMGNDNVGFGTVTYGASGALPTDGTWHHISFWYDWAAGSGKVFHNGTESSSTFWAGTYNDVPTLPPTDLQGRANLSRPAVIIKSHLPISDVMLDIGTPYTGIGMWADQYPTPIAPGLNMITRRTDQRINALAEPAAVNAWDTIAELARNTLSSYRINEADNLEFLPLGYFGETAQLTSSGAVNTWLNAGDLDVSQDPSKIRNVVTVQFEDTRIDSRQSEVISMSTAVQLPRGTTVITFPTDRPIVEVHGAPGKTTVWDLTNLTSAQIAAPTTLPLGNHFFSANTSQDGTGTVLASTSVYARILEGDAASITVRFINFTSNTAWISNNGDSVPYLRLLGYGVSANDGYSTQRDAASVARRGERGLDSLMSWVHNRADAEDMALTLASMLSEPRPELSADVVGDPRRRPGQLVTVSDAEGTDAAGTWRVLSVDHTMVGAQYTQGLAMLRVLPEGIWDQSNWDEAVWSA